VLLNKVIVLDKGFVAPLCFSGNGKILQDLQSFYFSTGAANLRLMDIATATLVIKCPLFIQLNLSQYSFSILNTNSKNIEAYIPDITMISGGSLEERQEFARYIEMTTEALILNQKSIPMDGGSVFTAQLLTPINVYNEIIVHGKLSSWVEFLKQKRLPLELELYRKTIEDALLCEWKNITNLIQ
jgi:hypothetical protein